MLIGYKKYQLEWMIEHGYSLEDLMEQLTRQEGYLNIKKVFEDWEGYTGFDESEIWVCEDEWKANEALEINDYTSYNIGFINNDGKEDETQFDVSKRLSVDEVFEELMNLFYNFCKENQIENKYIISINKVEE